MVWMRTAAVTLTALFVVLLVWLYGVKTTVIWGAAMTGFLVVLWAVTTPLRNRQRRVWREMGLGPDGRPISDEEEEVQDAEPPDDEEAGS